MATLTSEMRPKGARSIYSGTGHTIPKTCGPATWPAWLSLFWFRFGLESCTIGLEPLEKLLCYSALACLAALIIYRIAVWLF